jgi:hypothetical protein
MYAKYCLVIPFRTLGILVLPVRSSNASRFCRFYVDVIEVLAYIHVAPIEQCLLIL